MVISPLPQVNAYNDVETMPQCDVVVVALKTTQNHLYRRCYRHSSGMMGSVGIANGLAVEEEVAKIVGNVSIIGGLFFCSNKVEVGHIRHLDYGQITLEDMLLAMIYWIE